MIAVKSDVAIEELQGVARNLRLNWWLQYLQQRRCMALGIPPVLLGLPAPGAAMRVGEIVFQDFITRIQLIQVYIGDAIETQLLYPLAKARFGENIPKPRIVWKPVVIEDRNMRSQRLVQALQAGAISINEFREEFGFESLDDPKYKEVKGSPTAPQGVPTGMPKVPTFAKPPPEGVRKKSEEEILDPDKEFRVKKMHLLVTQEQFKNELLDVVRWAQFELKQGDQKVSDIKKTALEKSKGVIDKYISDSYLYGKLDTIYSNLVKDGKVITPDLLTITKEDLPTISKLKRKYNKDFKEIVEDMIKDKEKGLY